jgi:hypothetical protein
VHQDDDVSRGLDKVKQLHAEVSEGLRVWW